MWVVGVFLHESYYGFGVAYTITSAISMRYFTTLSMSMIVAYSYCFQKITEHVIDVMITGSWNTSFILISVNSNLFSRFVELGRF